MTVLARLKEKLTPEARALSAWVMLTHAEAERIAARLEAAEHLISVAKDNTQELLSNIPKDDVNNKRIHKAYVGHFRTWLKDES